MTRLTQELIDRLKTDISLIRVIKASGVTLSREGEDWVGRCPFHADMGQSLAVSVAANQWQCRGNCQNGGSVIDWVMRAEGVSFRHAAEILRNGYPDQDSRPPSSVASPSEPGRSLVRSRAMKLPTPLHSEADDQILLREVIAFYHDTLRNSPEVLGYLTKRGIASREAADRFRLGYANRTLAYRLPGKHVREGAAIRGRLQRLGILRGSGHEHFNGSLVIPIFDEAGNVVQIYGRKIREDLRPGTPSHLCLPGPKQGVWNVDALREAEEIILCKALIDGLTFWCAGYRNVTAACGYDGFTRDHLNAFRRHGVQRVLFAFGRDETGDRAAEELAPKLAAEGFDCYRLEFPKGMDANSYALHVQPAAKSLGVVIRSAVWLGKGERPAPVITSDALTHTVAPLPPIALNEADGVSLLPPQRVPAKEESTADVLPRVESPSERSEGMPETEPLPAARIPRSAQELAAEVSEDEIVLHLGDRRYRIRGLVRNTSYDMLRVNLLVSRAAPDGVAVLMHVDTFDLYLDRHRASFIRQAGIELGLKDDVIKKDLGRLLLKLEALQDEMIKKALVPKDKTVTLDEAEREEALALLRDPNLLQRILEDFDRCGLVREETNKLVGYLAATSRKLDSPLAVLVQSSSAAGKSSLMEAVLAFMPEEDKVQYSAMTGQSLFYMEQDNLRHKILAIAEEEGAVRASFALKLLQSEGGLTIASTGKDPQTGRLVAQNYSVEGPVMIFSTTTAIDRDEELLNRCLILGVDESRAQTRAIHQLQRQRRTLQGLLARKDKERLLKLHRNAQRLLQPLAVMNPYADCLTFRDDRTRLRRDHEKYLTLIDTIALLQQYQRRIKTTVHQGETLCYVEVTLDDIEVANRLAHEVLGRTLDELAPQTRGLLIQIEQMVKEACASLEIERSDYRFSRKDVRQHSGWSDFQVKVHMHKLEELEYVLVLKGGRGQSFVYELLYNGEGKQGEAFVMGLLDVEKLRRAYNEKKEGLASAQEASSSPQGGRKEPWGCEQENRAIGLFPSALSDSDTTGAKNACSGLQNPPESYRSEGAPPPANRGGD